MPSTNPKHKFLFVLQLISALSGIALSVYLFWEHIRLALGIQAESSFCRPSQYVDCAAVTTSSFATIASIPIAALGVMYFLAQASLLILHRSKSRQFEAAQRWSFWLAAIAFTYNVYLTYVQTALVQKFCTLCIVTYAANIVLLIAAGVRLYELNSGKTLLAGLIGERGKRLRLPAGSWVAYCALAAVASLSLYSISASQLDVKNSKESTQDAVANYVDSFSKQPSKMLSVGPGDGIHGSQSHPVQVVVFSDFECPYCKRAASMLQEAVKPYIERVYMVFKHYPLDSSCNSALKQPMHPNACKLAALAYCANEKGKFWPYHDLVFYELQGAGLDRNIAELGPRMSSIFTKREIDQCLTSKAAQQKVQEDIALGNSLGIRATPTVFINGKQVVLPLSNETLTMLLRAELGLK